ncbi:hypothetical protein ACIRU3_30955 [Streptomyces sp. NPDC101151]|uniref:hypothetical protein n=1 Tax=Streptomyces sp. NPDC101151 TaxID=3366115 RepID=UPI00382A1127
MGRLETWGRSRARRRRHNALADEGSATPSPTHHEPERLAAELRLLAGHPRCAAHAAALARLADAVQSSSEDELRPWAGGGLVTAYCGPDALSVPPSAEGARGRRLLSALPSVLVFAPLLVTWAGLGAAAYAYQRMRDSGATGQDGTGPSGSFLTLWQQGFDGHLWPVLRFDTMVVYTVVALLALMGTTVLGRLREAAEEAERQRLVSRLSAALVQVEALAVRTVHASPARFAEELQGAASGLRDLLCEATRVHERARHLLKGASTAAEQHLAAVKALESAVAELRAGTTDVRTSVGSATRAADEVAAGTRRLAEELARSGSAMAEGVDKAGRLVAERIGSAGELAAVRIGSAGELTAERIDRAALEAQERDQAAGERAAEWMRQAVREVTAALAAVRASTADSTQVLAATLDGLHGTLTGLPAALERAATEGAEHIGDAYDLAVAALAVSLRDEVRTVTAELAARIAEMREAALAHRGDQSEARDRLLKTVEQVHGALRVLVDALPRTSSTGPAAQALSAPQEPHGPSRPQAPPAASAQQPSPAPSSPQARPMPSARASAPPTVSLSRPVPADDPRISEPAAEVDR